MQRRPAFFLTLLTVAVLAARQSSPARGNRKSSGNKVLARMAPTRNEAA